MTTWGEQKPSGIIGDSVVKMTRLDDAQDGPAKLEGVAPKFIRGIAVKMIGNHDT